MFRKALCFACVLAVSSIAFAEAATNDPSQLAQTTADKALDYLKTQQQPDNSWQNDSQGEFPGITALVQRAFLSDSKYDADIPFLDKSFDHLLSVQQPDGGIYVHMLADYNTAICISTLAISQEAEYQAAIHKVLAYLRSTQWSDKIQGVPELLRVANDKDPRYGGFGYGKAARPDLSNTQFAIEALRDAGVKTDDPAYAAALKFATRCQNFRRRTISRGRETTAASSTRPHLGACRPRATTFSAGGACSAAMAR